MVTTVKKLDITSKVKSRIPKDSALTPLDFFTTEQLEKCPDPLAYCKQTKEILNDVYDLRLSLSSSSITFTPYQVNCVNFELNLVKSLFSTYELAEYFIHYGFKRNNDSNDVLMFVEEELEQFIADGEEEELEYYRDDLGLYSEIVNKFKRNNRLDNLLHKEHPLLFELLNRDDSEFQFYYSFSIQGGPVKEHMNMLVECYWSDPEEVEVELFEDIKDIKSMSLYNEDLLDFNSKIISKYLNDE